MKTIILSIGIILASLLAYSQSESDTIIIHHTKFDTTKNARYDTTHVKMKKGKILIITEKEGDFNDSIHWEDDYCCNKKFYGHWSGFEFGLNNFLNKDKKMNLPDEAKLMDINTSESWAFHFNFMHKSIGLVGHNFGLVTGMGINFNNYRFQRQVIIHPDSMPLFFSLDTVNKFKKNKLAIGYLTIPVLFEARTCVDNTSLYFQFGAIASIKLFSKQKQIYDNDQKHVTYEDFRINPFKLDVTARAGYGAFNLFANYSLTPLFEKNKGPELYPITVGLGLSF